MRPHHASLGLIVLMGVLSSCGASGPPSAPAQTIDLAPQLEEGARYEILHRETRQVEGEPARRVQVRTVLEVQRVLPDGARRIRARLFRSTRDTGDEPRLVDEVVTFDIQPDGRVRHDPQTECGDVGGLRVGRYLRHLVGARAFAAQGVGEGSRWGARYLSDAIEQPVPARFVLDEVGRRLARGRLSSRLTMEEGDVGPVRVSGEARVRGTFTVALPDGFAGRTDLRTTVRGEVTSDGHRRRGVVRTRSQIIVRPERGDEPLAMQCGAFDPGIVTREIRSRIREIQLCYERQLRDDPTLAGRVMMRFTIGVDGRTTNVLVAEDNLGNAAVASCMTSAVERFRFRPGPVGGSVSFAYPFVFAPQTP